MDAADEIAQVVVPTEEEIEVKGGQKRTVTKKTLPGYVLIQMKMSDKAWDVVRNTPGVTGFVSGDNKPLPLKPEEVDRILKQMKSETPRVKIGFHKGQGVRVTEGPFVDFVGIVYEISEEKGKVKVLLSIFGRETPVEVDFSQLEKL